MAADRRTKGGGERSPGGEGRRKPPLPPGLDLLWGRRSRGSRGPRPGLSVEAIVAAAIRLAEADGLAAVSMARVAAELGFTTMSLYRHVANKDELLQLMWNASARGAEDYVVEGEEWRERLRAWSLAQKDALDRHPWITEMPAATPPMGPNSLTFVERGLETLEETGLADVVKLRVIGLISSYALSESRMAHEAARAAAAARGEGPRWSFAALLRELVDAERYPHLHRVAASDEVDEGPAVDEERADFLFGLELILDGVADLIERSSPGPR